MRILYHHRTASKDGQAVHIDEMVAALRELGHEVRVVGPAPDGGAMGATVGWVQRLRRRLPKVCYELLELAYSALAYRRLAAAAREFRPDVIYERYNLYLLAGVMLKRRLRIPLLLEVNSPLADEREAFGGLGWAGLARWSERFVWRRADAVLPVTQVLAAIIQRQAGIDVDRLHVVPNGINERQFATAPPRAEARARLGLGEDELVLGFVGFVRDWHRVDRALHWLASPDAPASSRLLVVGDGPARGVLEQLASELGLAARVRFSGVVPRDALPAWVAAFDIALQPAVTPYASPLKLFEYLVMGQAIVAPAVPNIEEVLRHDHNALLFDVAREDALPAALTRLARDAALRRALGARARATIGELSLTWRGNAERVGALAARLCRAGDAGTSGIAPATR